MLIYIFIFTIVNNLNYVFQSNKLEDYRGKNQAFYKMLEMYTKIYKLKYKNNITNMIKGNFVLCHYFIYGNFQT